MIDLIAANDNLAPAGGERRRTHRRRVLLRGKIVHLTDDYGVDCVIRDLSRRGARINIAPEAVMTNPYLMVVRDGVAHHAVVSWRWMGDAGLTFCESHPLRGDVEAPLKDIKRLWSSLAMR